MVAVPLETFLRRCNGTYVQFADRLREAGFGEVEQLAAATPLLLRDVAEVPLGPACVIVKAAGGMRPPADDIVAMFNHAGLACKRTCASLFGLVGKAKEA